MAKKKTTKAQATKRPSDEATKVPTPAPETPEQRGKRIAAATSRLQSLIGWHGPLGKAQAARGTSQRQLAAAADVVAYREEQLLASAEVRQCEVEAPWIEPLSRSGFGFACVREFGKVGASDEQVRAFAANYVERSHWCDCVIGRFVLGASRDGDRLIPLLGLWGALLNQDEALVRGDELIRDIRTALNLPYPKAAKAPAPKPAPKPDAPSKPKPIRKADKTAELKALTKAAEKKTGKKGSGERGQGSAKPPVLTYNAQEYQYKLSFRKDGHTRSKVAPRSFPNTGEGRDQAIAHLLKAAGFPADTVVEDRTGIPDAEANAATAQVGYRDVRLVQDGTHTPGMWRLEYTADDERKSIMVNIGSDLIADVRESAVKTLDVCEDSIDIWRDPITGWNRDDGYYLCVAPGRDHKPCWWAMLSGNNKIQDRFCIHPTDSAEVEDAIRSACKVLGLDPKDIRVFDNDGQLLNGTAADLLNTEGAASDEGQGARGEGQVEDSSSSLPPIVQPPSQDFEPEISDPNYQDPPAA